MIESATELRFALGALWNGYVVLIHATVFIAGTWLLLPMAARLGPNARAAVHATGLIGMLAVTTMGWMPIGWWAHVIPASVAEPLMVIGSTSTAVGSGSVEGYAPVLASLWVIWVAGAVLVLGRYALGWLVMTGVTRRAEPVVDREWTSLLRASCTRMGTAQTVELRMSPEVGTPLTWGFLDPVILIPSCADAWDTGHREMVLLHELAHVRRADCLLQALSRIALAWYWFHPAAWIANRGLRAAREESCDAMVLRCGVRRTEYAECLIREADVIRGDRVSPVGPVILAMARQGGLRRRVGRILSSDWRSAPRWLAAGGGVVVLAWALLVGSIRLAPERSVVWDALDSPDWRRRAYAAAMLSHSRHPEIRAELRRRAAGDPHPVVRSHVTERR